jgi:hypothetical protein
MTESVEFTFLWNDQHLMEVRISASNGRFSGTTNVYLSIDGLAEAAEEIVSFPRNPHDKRELRFGPKGLVTMRFFCEGEAGRSFIELSMESEHDTYQCAGNVKPENVRLHAAVEASAIDAFVSELRIVQTSLSGVARLKLVSPT